MSRRREMAVHHAPCVLLQDGRFVHSTEPREVRVMARAEGYAMVRRPGAMPYVAPEKELEPR